MRKQGRIIKNSVYSVANYILLILSGLLVRKILIAELSIDYAGYEALFTDIFAILSVADLGLDSIITYKLYESLTHNRDGIADIMSIARRLYRGIAYGILFIGLILIFLLPYLFSEMESQMDMLRVVFGIQIVNLGISYATGYAKILFIADQKEYICIKWDSSILILVQLARVVVLMVWGDYTIYVSLCIIQTIFQNVGIIIKCKKEYGDVFYEQDSGENHLGLIKKDIFNFMFHKISSVIYSATDNIVITSVIGIAAAGLYSNYYMISKYAYSLISKSIRPLQATIGNYLYQGSVKEEQYQVLSKLNIFSFMVASFLCNSLIHMSTPFIIIWLGKDFIQNQLFVFLLAVNAYIAINQDFIYYFRNSFGDYDYDKKYMILSAVTNLSLSIVFGIYVGISGIILATILGHLFIWYGRVKFVYKKYFLRSMKKYWMEQTILFGILQIQIQLAYFFIQYLDDRLFSLVLGELIIVGISVIIGVFLFITKSKIKKIMSK